MFTPTIHWGTQEAASHSGQTQNGPGKKRAAWLQQHTRGCTVPRLLQVLHKDPACLKALEVVSSFAHLPQSWHLSRCPILGCHESPESARMVRVVGRRCHKDLSIVVTSLSTEGIRKVSGPGTVGDDQRNSVVPVPGLNT